MRRLWIYLLMAPVVAFVAFVVWLLSIPFDSGY